MKVIIASVGGRVPPGQNKRPSIVLGPMPDKCLALADNFIRLPQLPDLTFQVLDPYLSGHAITHATVFLSLLDPFA